MCSRGEGIGGRERKKDYKAYGPRSSRQEFGSHLATSRIAEIQLAMGVKVQGVRVHNPVLEKT